MTFLGSRGLPLTAEERAVIEGCADPVRLDRWIAKAGTAGSVGEVLQPEKTARAKRAPRASSEGTGEDREATNDEGVTAPWS